MRTIIDIEIPDCGLNGDLVTNKGILEILNRQLPDTVELRGFVFRGWDDPDYESTHTIITSLPWRKLTWLFCIMEEYTGGFLLSANADLTNVIAELEEMGRYPKSQSEGDDFFVSFTYTIRQIPLTDTFLFEYFFDDSTR